MSSKQRCGGVRRLRGSAPDGRWAGGAAAAAAGLAILAAAELPVRADARAALLQAEGAPDDTTLARTAGWPFPAREDLRYAVRLGRLQLGRGRIVSRPDTSIPGVDAQRVSLTIDVGAAFAEIHDRHVTWLAPDPLRTLRLRKRYREFGEEKGGTWTLDHAEGVSRRAGDGAGDPMPEAALDGLGLLYLLRTMDLETGDTIRLDRHFQAEHNPVVFRVTDRERIRVPAGRYRTLVVEPVIPALDVFGEDRDARIWLSDDERRLIVRVESATRFGALQLHLRRYTSGPPGDD